MTVTELAGGGSYRLAWSDEFDGARGSPPDRSTWQAETGGSGWGNRELQYYTDESGNAALDGAGNLAIVVRRIDPDLARRRYAGCRYTSARLISRDRMSLRYGLVQARIKIPRAHGVWPAFWMLGQDITSGSTPRCASLPDAITRCQRSSWAPRHRVQAWPRSPPAAR